MKTKIKITKQDNFEELYDIDIRKAFKKMLLNRYSNSNALIVEELGLLHGIARIDLAVINGLLHGYEFKSDKDSLDRLPHQLKIYNLIFNKVTVIVGTNHIYSIMQKIPNWWGLKLAEKGPRGGIHFYNLRNAQNNLSVNKLHIAKLLWKEEAIEVLDEFHTSKGFKAKKRYEVYEELCKHIDLKTLQKKIYEIFSSRTNWKVD